MWSYSIHNLVICVLSNASSCSFVALGGRCQNFRNNLVARQAIGLAAYIQRCNCSSAVVHFSVPQRLPGSGRDDDDIQLQINIRNIDSGEEWTFLRDFVESVSFTVPIPLPPGHRFALNGRLLRCWSPPLKENESVLAQSGSLVLAVRAGYKTIDTAHAVFRAGK